MSEPFTIGAKQWPGLAKTLEETSELSAVLAQLIAFPGGYRPDGKDLIESLHEEVADALAAIDVLIGLNPDAIDYNLVGQRRRLKVEKYLDWHNALTGIDVPTDADHRRTMGLKVLSD